MSQNTILNYMSVSKYSTPSNLTQSNNEIKQGSFLKYLCGCLSNYKILNEHQIKHQINAELSNIDFILFADNFCFLIKTRNQNESDVTTIQKFIQNGLNLVSIMNKSNISHQINYCPIFLTKDVCDSQTQSLMNQYQVFNLYPSNIDGNLREKMVMKLYNFIVSKTGKYQGLIDYPSSDTLMSYEV